MNQQHHRLVCNARRGQFMAVAETARAPGGQVGTRRHPHRALAAGLSLILGGYPLFTSLAQAQIVADPSAPGTQRPTVLAAPNGVPAVNIQTPSAAGVSRNSYSQFDVTGQGAILNNSRGNVQSQLGGWLQGNPWLAAGSAKVILNEVNSSNPSQIRGYIEIAGQRAELVIANPAGIHVDGGGFINAARAILTTGTPQWGAGGSLDGYRVQRGTVIVNGQGLDATLTDYTGILARAAQLNAGLWANNLAIVTGQNTVGAAAGENGQADIQASSQNAGGQPQFALDVSHLGGMYAGKIALVGTEAGVGVRHAGAMGASAGQVTLTADGKLVNTGIISTAAPGYDVVIDTAGRGLDNSGTISSQRDVQLAHSGDTRNSGTINAARALEVDAGALDNTAGTLTAQRLQIAAASLNNTGGRASQTGTQDLSISAASVRNSNAGGQTGTIGAVPLRAVDGSPGSNPPAASVGGAPAGDTPGSADGGSTVVQFTGSSAMLPAGRIVVTGAIDNAGGEIVANGAADLSTSQALANSGRIQVRTLDSQGSLDNSAGQLQAQAIHTHLTQLINRGGDLAATDDLRLDAGTLDNTRGRIATAGALTAQVQQSIDNRGGALLAEGDLSATSPTIDNGAMDGQAGLISSNSGNVHLDAAQAIANRGGRIQQADDAAGKALTLQTSALDNSSGHIVQVGGGATSISAVGQLTNDGGQITTNGALALQGGAVSNAAGEISAQKSLQAQVASLSNNSGRIQAQEALALNNLGALDNQGGNIAANGALTVTSLILGNQAGHLASAGDAVDVATGALDNTAGSIAAQKAVRITSAALANIAGGISGETVAIDTRGQQLINQGGQIAAANALVIDSGKLDNANGGALVATGSTSTLTLDSHGGDIVNSRSGAQGGILASGTAQIDTQGGRFINADGGYLGAAGALQARARQIDNAGGVITAGGDSTLASTTTGGVGIDNSAGGAIEVHGGITLDAGYADLDNRNGHVAAHRDLRIDGGGQVLNQQGTMLALGTLAIDGSQSTVNTGGTLHAGQLLAFSHTSVTGDGALLSDNDVSISQRGDYIQLAGGQLSANGALTLAVSGNITNQGDIKGGTGVTVSANSVDNQTGASITSAGTTTVRASNTLTNRGLIDGDDTATDTGMLDNVGTGRIYGDHVAIQTGALGNRAEGAASAIIAARHRLDIGAQTIDNLGGSTLLSLGDLNVAGSLNGDHYATVGQAVTITNAASTIESLGHMTLAALALDNTNPGLEVDRQVFVSTVAGNNMYQPPGEQPQDASLFTMIYRGSDPVYSGFTDTRLVRPNHPDLFGTVIPAAINTQSSCVEGYCTVTSTTYASASSPLWAQFGLAPPPGYDTATPNPARYGAVIYERDYGTEITWPAGSNPAGYNAALANYDASIVAVTALDDAITARNRENNSSSGSWRQYAAIDNVTHTTYEDQVKVTTPGTIRSGRDITLHGQLNNVDSTVIAGGAINIDQNKDVNNHASDGVRTVVTKYDATQVTWSYGGIFSGGDSAETVGPITSTIPTSHSFKLPTITYLEHQSPHDAGAIDPNINGGKNVSAATGSNGPVRGGGQVPVVSQVTLANATGSGNTLVRTASPSGALPSSSLYILNPGNGNAPLIATDPAFTNYRTWLGSDYMISALGIDPAQWTKRMGDGFWEQQQIEQQVAELTGRRFLGDYRSDDKQYRALMNAGVSFAQAVGLRPGVALTPEQMAQLTSDIVWLVEKTVTLADGTQRQALVPQIYVLTRTGDLTASGALISGESVRISGSGEVKNSGTIAGRALVAIDTGSIQNLGGRISAMQVGLQAASDINVIGGQVDAREALVAQAGRDLNVRSSVTSSSGDNGESSYRHSTIDRVAGLYVSGEPGDVLVASAGRDLDVAAAVISNQSASGVTALAAGRDLTLGTIATEQANAITFDQRRHVNTASTSDVGSQVGSAGSLTLAAGRDLQARAASVEAGGALAVQAGRDIRIDAGRATQSVDDAYYAESHSLFGSSSGSLADKVYTERAQASTFSGDTVVLRAANDVIVTGSNVVGTGNVKIDAGHDVTIAAAANRQSRQVDSEQHESGLFSSGGVGFTIGNQKVNVNQSAAAETAAASTVGSVRGNVAIHAGNAYLQMGSDLLAPAGDIEISAKKVMIAEARERAHSEMQTEFKQSGLTVALSSPVIGAIQTAQQMGDAAGHANDPRMQALAAAASALAAKNAAGAVQAGQASDSFLRQAGGLDVSVSLGSAKSSSTSIFDGQTARGSTLQAAGDIRVSAAGAANESNLLIRGSDLKAGGTIALAAENAIELQAAKNNASQESSSQSSSGSIGVAVGTSGVSAMVSASRARGTSDGSDTTWSNTHLSADRAIELHSGGDTTLMGAVASAPKISADVGGDLTIASLQDTSHYQSQQRSLGGSAGVGITAGGVGVTGSISAGNSHINSDYASVAEQSALRAGNGGFDVNVAGNTTLAGGAITSTQAAVDTGANRFQTTNLTTSDIVNTASYDANAAAAAIGTSINFTGQYQAPGNSAGLGSDGGGVSSTTQAAISGIAGNKDARTGDVESTITPIFDAERVQQEINAQVQITQAFAHEAYVTVDKYVSERRGRLRDNIRHTDNEDERANLQTQLDDLALQERVINVLIGAVTGSAGVAATNEAFSAAADGMRQTSIENSMRFKGIIDNAGNVISNVSGESEGLKGDWIKLGGTRVDLDALCGTDNSRCVKDNDQLALKDGYVQFTGLPDNPMTLTQYLDTPEGQKMLGATGGLQGAKGTIFGYEYAPGSMMDRIVEAFAGTHDFIGGQLSNLYDEQGNAKRGRSSTEAFLYDRWSEAAIPLAAPFAMSEALPQPVWQAISVLLKNTR